MSEPITRVFIDIDAVLACFSKAACERCSIPYPTQTEMADRWLDDATAGVLWKHCRGYTFWFELELLPWAATLRDIVRAHTDQWIYMSKPSLDSDCYSAKYDWINRHFKDAGQRLWLTNGDKSIACRGPGDMLIDDKLKNVENWARAGGTPFHWPEITPDYPSDLVRARLDALKAALEGRA